MTRKLRYFLLQLKQRNGEHEQVVLRILFTPLIWCYAEYFNVTGFPMWAINGLIGYSTALLLITFLAENTSRPRQWVAMVLDIAITTAVMLTTGEVGAVYFWVYLWVTLGNGLRYGKLPLMGAYLMSVAGFGSVLIWNDYWRQHAQLSTGYFLTLFLVPIYALKLVAQLNQAIEKATLSDKAKSYLLATMNHELRTPLNGIVGASALLGDTNMTQEQRKLVSMLNRSAKILHNIIDNLLNLTKTDITGSHAANAAFNLPTVINNTLEMFQIQAMEKRVSLTVEYENEVRIDLIGDTVHLQQILINLIGNAIKFSKAGGSVKLRISTVFYNEVVERVRFEISDNGIGIKPEEKTKLFHKFVQANVDISKNYGGSGLGIAIARDLVNIMNGDIGVQSHENQGSTFWFEVPLIKQTGSTASVGRTAKVTIPVMAIGLTDTEKSTFAGMVSGWDMSFTSEDSLPLFFNAFLALKSSKCAVIYRPGTVGLDPEHFAKHVLDVSEGKTVAMILVDPDRKYTAREASKLGYSSLLHAPFDKTLLFNAIQNNSAPADLSVVTSLREQYEKKRNSINILIADDNSVNRSITSRIVERAGHHAVLAEDGDQALDKLETNNIDLMILDMKMPVMDGVDVVRIYRAMSTNSKYIPIIILTANATLDARHECMEAGADAFLTKPVNHELLLETVDRLTTGKAPKDPPPETRDAIFQPNDALLNEDTLGSLKMLGGGQIDFTKEVLLGFIEEVSTVLNRMDEALSKKDLDIFRTLAYSIQGGSSNVGADSLFRISNDVTNMNQDKLRTDGAAKLNDLRECFKLTQTKMIKYLGAHPA